jgi:phytoene dehydrogenase-like protein
MARLSPFFPPGPPKATPVPGTAAAQTSRHPASSRPPLRRAALAGAVLLALAAAHLAGNDAASAHAAAADPELAWLLRSMALTKAAMAAAAVWLADRLLRLPLGTALAAGLIAAAATMAAAPVLMWHVAHVGTGALLFHGGMLLLLVLGWRPTEAWLATRRREPPR